MRHQGSARPLHYKAVALPLALKSSSALDNESHKWRNTEVA